MSTTGSTRRSPRWVGDRTRVAGSAYLGLAGLVNVVAGAWLVWHVGSVRAMYWLIDVTVGTLGELGGLERGGMIDLVVTVGFPVVGAALVLVGAIQLFCGWQSARGRGHRRAIGAAVLGCLNPLALPPGIVAAALFGLARDRFARDASAA